MKTPSQAPQRSIRLLHAGLATFGIAAYLTGELVGDSTASAGYWLHAGLGLMLGMVLLGYLFTGLAGKRWHPGRWWHNGGKFLSAIAEDAREVMQLRMPRRQDHNGLAGLVQASGLTIFLWMSLTGAILFFSGGPAENGIVHLVEEAHEASEFLVPVFLGLHIGAVILHTLSGHAILQRMNPFNK